ncbi:MAG: NUDIX domain-containing protein [Clostridia bacterium]
MEELWDVYDRYRNKTGKIVNRSKICDDVNKLNEHEYHIVVHVWVKNFEGKWLISKRAVNKTHPNMWEPTRGSALSSEESRSAATREVLEELGVTLPPSKGTHWGSYLRHIEDRSEISDIWVFKCDVDIKTVVCNPKETSDARFATSDEIEKLVAENKFIKLPYIEDLFLSEKSI